MAAGGGGEKVAALFDDLHHDLQQKTSAMYSRACSKEYQGGDLDGADGRQVFDVESSLRREEGRIGVPQQRGVGLACALLLLLLLEHCLVPLCHVLCRRLPRR